MMHRQMQQEDPKAEILAALRMTDKQKKGYIQASELRAKLTKLGEKLTDKEGNEPVDADMGQCGCDELVPPDAAVDAGGWSHRRRGRFVCRVPSS